MLDYKTMMEQLDDDTELLTELTELFLGAYPQEIRSLRAAVERNDSQGVTQAAHSLKGMVSNFRADCVAATALQLEILGREAQLADAPKVLHLLVHQMDEMARQLREIQAPSSLSAQLVKPYLPVSRAFVGKA